MRRIGPLANDLGQRFALDEIHREVILAILNAEIVNRHDVGMLEPGRGLGLLHEPRNELRRCDTAALQNFQRNDSIEALLPGFVDDPDAAAGHFPEDLVIAEFGEHRRASGGGAMSPARVSENDSEPLPGMAVWDVAQDGQTKTVGSVGPGHDSCSWRQTEHWMRCIMASRWRSSCGAHYKAVSTGCQAWSSKENKKSPPRGGGTGSFTKLPWQRPTLAQAIQALPSALQRFTAVFGMGTGGTTAVMPPGNRLSTEQNVIL